MKMEDVRRKFKAIGLNSTPRMKKSEMIKAIQTAEGNKQCFGTDAESCCQVNCCWRDDCMSGK